MGIPYADRRDAGRQLAARLRDYAGDPRAVVLGLPRGGVPVAYEVARALGAPLDIFLVRKLGVPGHEELAFGALAAGGARVYNEALLGELMITHETIEAIAAREGQELERRERAYRGERPPSDVRGRVAMLVDDGLATGATMRAAVAALRGQGPARIVVAVPVGAPSTCALLRAEADEVVCAAMPEPFYAVGQWYDDFSETSDDEVRALLAAVWSERDGGALLSPALDGPAASGS
jgi:predicted phosphoribosyltransferase